MAIISILVALVIASAQGIIARSAQSRATAEVEWMKKALENYKLDNGSYPAGQGLLTGANGAYPKDPSIVGGPYQQSSQLLYQALAGKATYLAPPGGKAYMLFQTTQLGNYKASSTGNTYIQDPWNYSYGYSTGDTNSPQTDPPENGTGFYDLWSTGGTSPSSSVTTNAWITNWR